jgi:hypothetical protein
MSVADEEFVVMQGRTRELRAQVDGLGQFSRSAIDSYIHARRLPNRDNGAIPAGVEGLVAEIEALLGDKRLGPHQAVELARTYFGS